VSDHGRAAMYHAVRTVLIEVAQASETINYKALAERVGFDVRANGCWLSPICKILNALCADSPRMLSAVVVNQRRKRSGVGFFKCARDLGRLSSKDADDERAFWEAELTRVHAHRWE